MPTSEIVDFIDTGLPECMQLERGRCHTIIRGLGIRTACRLGIVVGQLIIRELIIRELIIGKLISINEGSLTGCEELRSFKFQSEVFGRSLYIARSIVRSIASELIEQGSLNDAGGEEFASADW
jgi:hypothetical protein